jgi:hypothetical protein
MALSISPLPPLGNEYNFASASILCFLFNNAHLVRWPHGLGPNKHLAWFEARWMLENTLRRLLGESLFCVKKTVSECLRKSRKMLLEGRGRRHFVYSGR